MANASAKTNFITNVRIATTALLDAKEELDALLDEWTYYMNVEIADIDFLGDNDGLVKNDIANVLGTTLTAINAIGSGNFTNLYKVKRWYS